MKVDYKKYWKTRNGECIKYSDMTDLHLLQVHAMIEESLIAFTNHCMAINEELEVSEDVQDMLNSVEEELNKRGLLE